MRRHAIAATSRPDSRTGKKEKKRRRRRKKRRKKRERRKMGRSVAILQVDSQNFSHGRRVHWKGEEI